MTDMDLRIGVPARARGTGPGAVFLASVLVFSFLYCYMGVISALVRAWRSNPVYSHGFIIPFISIYLVWMKRERLGAMEAEPGVASGGMVFGGAVLSLLVAWAAGVIFVQELSLIMAVAGIVLLVLGPAFLKELAFPIAYLAFMVRFWDSLTTRLHLPLQKFSASLGTALLHAAGVPAYSESIYIELPNITLEVADVCSGVNYLISVVAMGVLLGHVFLGSWQKRTLLVAVGVVIAILANSFRVALIGFLAYHGMAGDLHGPNHVLQALFVSFAGFLALFIGTWALSDKPRRAAQPEGSRAEKASRGGATPAGRRAGFLAVFSSVVLLGAGAYINLHKPHAVQPRASLESLPYGFGQWKGTDCKSAACAGFRADGADLELARVYWDGTGREFGLYIGYFAYQDHGKELVGYSTSRLHDGATRVGISLRNGDRAFLNKVSGKDGEILFAYIINGKIIGNRYMAKSQTAMGAVIKGDTSGAIVVISGELSRGSNGDMALASEVVESALGTIF